MHPYLLKEGPGGLAAASRTRVQGLWRASSLSRAAACFLSTAASSLALLSRFQRTSSVLSPPRPLQPSREAMWL